MYSRPDTLRSSSKSWDFLIANLIVILALVATYWFPKQESIWRAVISDMVFFVVFPLTAIRFFIRRPLADFGFGWGRTGVGAFAVFAAAIFFGVFAFAVFSGFSVVLEDILPKGVYLNFGNFLKYMLVLWAFSLGTEVLFRGLVLFGWERVVGGTLAIVVQAIGVTLLTGLNGYLGDGIETWRVVLYGGWSLLAGIVAYASRSVVYSFIFSMLSVILMVVVSLAIL